MGQGLKTGETWAGPFTTQNPTTGALADADALPTGTLFVNGTADAATVSVASVTGTGKYTFSVTLPTVADNDSLSMRIDATVGGTAGGGVVARAQGTTARVADADDTATLVAAIWDELTATGRVAGSYGQLFKDNVDAAISAVAALVWDRLTSALTTPGSAGALLVGNLDVNVGSRATSAQVDSSNAAQTAELKGLIDEGTATGGSSNTIDLRVGAPAVPTYSVAYLKVGTGTGQARIVLGDASGTLSIFPDWETDPVAGTEYEIYPSWVALVDMFSIVQNQLAASNLRAGARGIVEGVAAAGTLTTTQFSTNLTETEDNQYVGRDVVFLDTAANLAGQRGRITAYSGSTKIITVETPLTQAPTAGDPFIIV